MDTRGAGSTLGTLVDEAVRRWPHAEAVIYDDGVQVHRLSYCDFGHKNEKVCTWLRRVGVLKEVVAVALPPGPYLPSVLTGVMNVPAAFLPVNLHSASTTLQRTLTRLSVRVLLTDPSLVETLKKITSGDLRVERMEDLGIAVVWFSDVRRPSEWMTSQAYVITTSGSTGDPKIVRVPHECIVPNITHIRSIYKMSPCDVSVLMSPLTFDPSIVEMFTSLTSGSRLLLIPDFMKMVPKILVETLTRHKVTVMQVTPSVMSSIGLDLLKFRVLSSSGSLRLLALGGETCPHSSTLRSWRGDGNTTEFVNLYGITEVSSWAMYHVLTEHQLSSQVEIPLGSSLHSTNWEVRGDSGKTVTDGQGQLFIGSLSRRCLLDNEENPPPDGMRATGDWVRIDGDGRLSYRGRIDRQIKRHGMRMNLDSLEQVVMEMDALGHCSAFLSEQGSELHLVIQTQVLTPNVQQSRQKESQCCRVEDSLKSEVMQYLHQRLPAQYIPDAVWTVTRLPFTRHGKVDRIRLREMISQHGEPSLPEHVQESKRQIVEKIWKECLYLPGDHVPADRDTLLTSGGDSFGAVRFLNLLSDNLGDLDPSLLEVILTKTYSDILAVVEGHKLENLDSKTIMKHQATGDENKDDGETIASAEDKNRSAGQNTKRPRDSLNVDKINTKIRVLDSDNLLEYEPVADKTESCCVALSRANHQIHLCNRGNSSRCVDMEKEQLIIKTQKTTSDTKLGLRVEWSWDTGKCIDASPLVLKQRARSLVFIGSHSHKFAAVDLETGEFVWEQVLGDRIESSACISPCGENVVVGCYDGLVYVMDVHTGHVVWTFTTRGQVKSSPCCDPGTGLVYIGSHDQHVYALNIAERRCQWFRHLDAGSVYSSPALSPRTVLLYVATLGGVLAALYSVTGELSWRRAVGKPIFSSPCPLPGGVAVGCVDGQLYSFSDAGEKLWTFQTSGPVFSSPCLHPSQSRRHLNIRVPEGVVPREMIVFGCHGKCFYCLDVQGKKVWEFATESEAFASPCVAALRFPPEKCKPVSSKVTDTTKYSSISSTECALIKRPTNPHLGSPVVVICSTSGRIYVVNIWDGRLLAEFTLKGEVFSSAVACDDCIYVGCRDNRLYCLKFTEDEAHGHVS